MAIEIRRFDAQDSESLWLYQQVPMEFRVDSVLEVRSDSSRFGAFSIREVPVENPWTKDLWDGRYEVEQLERFTCAHNSVFFLAVEEDKLVGGAAGIRHCDDAEYFCMTDGRDDIAVLRDIRVKPESKRTGVGTVLFEQVVDWARESGMQMLKIETQNNNVAACRFYQKMGARLGGLQRHAYGDYPDEVMLLWYVDL